MEVLKKVGINSAVKNLVLFLCYGLLITPCIHFTYGLNSPWPAFITAIFEGPLSILTFGIFSVIGLGGLAIATKRGGVNCDFELCKPKRVFVFTLPICDVAINLGAVIGGTLLGIAMAIHILFTINLFEQDLYQRVYGWSAFIFILTYPVAYFTIAWVDSKKVTHRWLNCSVVTYCLFILLLFFFPMPIQDATTVVGLVCAVLIAVHSFTIRANANQL